MKKKYKICFDIKYKSPAFEYVAHMICFLNYVYYIYMHFWSILQALDSMKIVWAYISFITATKPIYDCDI